MVEREDWIAKRAYELWEEAGRPDGLDEHHWAQAAAEWDQGVHKRPTSPAAWDDDEY